jgi:hypothetical protein
MANSFSLAHCSKGEAALIRKFAERLPAYVMDKQVCLSISICALCLTD